MPAPTMSQQPPRKPETHRNYNNTIRTERSPTPPRSSSSRNSTRSGPKYKPSRGPTYIPSQPMSNAPPTARSQNSTTTSTTTNNTTATNKPKTPAEIQKEKEEEKKKKGGCGAFCCGTIFTDCMAVIGACFGAIGACACCAAC
ncbi:hypothetical protein TWF225_003560 [Orbilia oligospora]|uniref:Uncharacterized protein n=1 Tax=Orbilia oligospora TaxID=2813651 RepID=A0A7C8KA62_ORBOL|nr:hypothetical protein TWF751_007461 [Orbilia oligospora]KAF3195140.1 hypothetical protein TWF225_003560 [Orbilia oligospora]KAF3259495.1 hypothetical protein TWF217_005191 [Orbilia oligospora]KAF3263979.1 hypothetical protein TWF128_001611 [Orbilia oligospora]KAF3287801.1 hypothetical protein TWF132_008321 [Orbilia oligospora]